MSNSSNKRPNLNQSSNNDEAEELVFLDADDVDDYEDMKMMNNLIMKVQMKKKKKKHKYHSPKMYYHM